MCSLYVATATHFESWSHLKRAGHESPPRRCPPKTPLQIHTHVHETNLMSSGKWRNQIVSTRSSGEVRVSVPIFSVYFSMGTLPTRVKGHY